MSARGAQDDERDVLDRALRGLGLTDEPDKYGDGIHSWRCEHPDRYGRCECFEEAISYILSALRKHSEPDTSTWEEGFRAGWQATGEGFNGEWPDEGIRWEASAGHEAMLKARALRVSEPPRSNGA